MDVITRLFPLVLAAGLQAAAPAVDIADWIRQEPTGQYARRTGGLSLRLKFGPGADDACRPPAVR